MSAAEFEELRHIVSEHYALLSRLGKAPSEGTAWGPTFQRYDEILQALVVSIGGLPAPALPWTNRERIEMDGRCRTAGLVTGGPLALPADSREGP